MCVHLESAGSHFSVVVVVVAASVAAVVAVVAFCFVVADSSGIAVDDIFVAVVVAIIDVTPAMSRSAF